MTDPLDLSGRVAVVTGGASGIGMGAVMAFARHGAKVAILDQDGADLEETLKSLQSEGLGAKTYKVDVSDEMEVRQTLDRVFQEFGRIDILHANAGVNGVWAPIEDLKVEEFDRTIAINLRGTFLAIKYAVPYLKRQGGSVIVTASVNGTRTFSNTGATAYSTSKAGQVALAKMLAVELGEWKIRVNVICPGVISTEIGEGSEVRNVDQVKVPANYPEGASPLTGKEPGSADEVGGLALFLASDLSNHITGEVVYIDAGSSLVEG